jgi:hypothetical protein
MNPEIFQHVQDSHKVADHSFTPGDRGYRPMRMWTADERSVKAWEARTLRARMGAVLASIVAFVGGLICAAASDMTLPACIWVALAAGGAVFAIVYGAILEGKPE